MRISDLLKMGFRNLRRRKARTALTVVGVVIGTISIVVMVSLGIGLNYCYEKTMMEYGSLNTLSIYQSSYVENEDGDYEEKNQENLMNDDFVEVLKQMEHVRNVTPLFNTSATISGNGWEANVSVIVMDFSVLPALDPPTPVSGEYDFTEGTGCVIIGQDAISYRYKPSTGKEVTTELDLSKERLFFTLDEMSYYEEVSTSTEMEDGTSAISEPNYVKPKKELIQDYVVVSDPNQYEYQWCVMMDMTYYKKLYEKQAKNLKGKERKRILKNIERYSEIRVIVDNVENVDKVSEEIRVYGGQTDGMGNYLEQVQNEAKIIELVLGGIGAVSMLVSAISIANTMVMSIYERTKEIGVMKVLGCVVSDIKKLFLLEAGVIGGIGGLIGIGLSYLISYVINHYGGPTVGASMGLALGEDGTIQLSLIPIWLSALALVFAFLVGIISGYFPARRATKIRAIEAMKSDG